MTGPDRRAADGWADAPPDTYDHEGAAAAHARRSDDEWFAQHRKATWRVRPLLTGESPITDAMARAMGGRAYALVIDHGRAKDRRQAVGRAVYPIAVKAVAPGKLRRELREQALHIVAGFKRRRGLRPSSPGVACFEWRDR